MVNRKTTAKGMRKVAAKLMTADIAMQLYERDKKIVEQENVIRKKNKEIVAAIAVGAIMVAASVLFAALAVFQAKPLP